MRSDDIRSQRGCGRFFIYLLALSIGLACFNLYNGRWGTALRLVPGMVCFGGISWWAFSDADANQGPDREQGFPGHPRRVNPCRSGQILPTTWWEQRTYRLLTRPTLTRRINFNRSRAA